jgi:glutamate-1-semialdehyde 2,1-aminomutase
MPDSPESPAAAPRPERTNRTLESACDDARSRYVASHPQCRELFERAVRHLPGGNTRTVLFYEPFPLTIQRAEGTRLYDADDKSYVDFLGEFTAGLYGHSHPAIRSAIEAALGDGMVFGAPNRLEAELAELVCQRFTSCEMVRFCNSGTEANLMALAAARGATGRSKIVVFRAGYHGGVLSYATPDSPVNVPFPIILADYNDAEGTRALIAAQASDIAAILVEPMQGSAGAIPALPGFLDGLREISQAHGIVLIFDEVMTSRLAPGGLQEKLGIVPDMTTFGKYIGGGLSCGAFGGSQRLMAQFDPRRPGSLGHSGTFNNNVLTMAAGIAGLRDVLTPGVLATLNQSGDRLRERLNDIAAQRGAAIQATGLGSILCLHPQQRTPIEQADDVTGTEPARALLQFHMIEHGFYLARRGFISLSLALTPEDHDGFAAAFESFVDEYGSLL